MLICTNKASSVFAAIEKIAATSSKIEKEALIKAAGTASPMFMRVVKAAYDPYVTYGMRALPDRAAGAAPGTNTLDEEWPWEIIEGLAKRRLTGQAAWDAVQKAMNFLDEPSAELMRRIIRKDLRAGFTDGTINRVFPKTLAEFPYMRCSLPDKSDMPKWDWSVGIISQEKADGMFANVNVDDAGVVHVSSRQGSVIPLDKLPLLEQAMALRLPRGHQTHGELTAWKDGKVLPREIGNGMLNSIIEGGSPEEGVDIRFDAWDVIPLTVVQPKGKFDIGYKKRLAQLATYMAANPHGVLGRLVGLIQTRIVKSKAQAWDHYRELLKQGKEGTVCKHPDAIWKDGTSKQQVKLKLEVDVDLQIVQVLPGTPGTKNEGRAASFQCETACGRLQVNVTVKNEKLRDKVDLDWDEYASKILVVRANSILPPSESNEFYSLFLPRMVEEDARSDKSVADDLEQVQAIFKAAVEAA